MFFSTEGGLRICLDRADIGAWQPLDPVYSNATLHWLDDHAALSPWLMEFLKPGGMLAVQMPDNQAAPAHRALGETLLAGPWRDRLDVWQTVGYHHLSVVDSVFDWAKGTAIRHCLEMLDADERPAFEEACRARLRAV